MRAYLRADARSATGTHADATALAAARTALDALDHLLLMALRYALPRTISTGEPDREVIAAWTSQLPWLPSWALSQALEECAHVDRGDAACAGALCDSPTMRAAASERRGRFRAAVAGELARRAQEGRE